MLRRFVLSTLALLLVAGPLFAQRPRPARRGLPPALPAVDRIAEAVLAEGVPGLTVGIRHGQHLIYQRGYGLHDVEQQIYALPSSIYQIGSITKQFTAAAIMRLSEQGRLNLADSISDYVPELNTHGQTITLEQLLTHTSGLPNYTDFLTDAYQPLTAQQMIDLINSRPPVFPPGTSWLYNNSGYYVLGLVIERASGQSYGRYLDLNFFKPLGLTRTSYCGGDPALPTPDGYLKLSAAADPFRVEAAEMSLAYAAGAICSTAGDLIRWNIALASGLAVRPDSYQRMIRRAQFGGGYHANYGYGLAIGKHLGRDIIHHGGAILGFQTFLAYYPAEDLTIAVLTNVLDLTGDHSSEVALAVAGELLE